MELITDNKNFDDFLKSRFVSGAFLQSSFWQEFLKKQNKRFWQLGVIEDENVIATALFYENKLPLDRSYLYSPKGPLISNVVSLDKQKEALELILSKARDITIDTKRKEEIFFRLELEDPKLILKRLVKSKDVQPRDSWVLDIDKDHKELLANMHTKTRYNIALAKRKKVEVYFSKEQKDLEDFLRLTHQTAKRNQISVHSDNYYKMLFETLVEHHCGELVVAKLEDKVVAVNMLIHFGQATTYLHGASDYQFRKYMAPQLLQWESIKKAQELGNKIYDFWGIAPEDGSKASWQGFTRFKKSFGGRAVFSPGAYDLIYDKSWYSLYNLSSKIRTLFKI